MLRFYLSKIHWNERRFHGSFTWLGAAAQDIVAAINELNATVVAGVPSSFDAGYFLYTGSRFGCS